MENLNKDYTIGLDIGTHSVGYAVLTDDYQLVRKKMKVRGEIDKPYIKKNFWGVRLFDGGKTAEGRRISRTTRRRIQRRRNRIEYLRSFFYEEMKGIDPNFFNRLDESFIVVEDKLHGKQPIFATVEEEIKYHEDFPTIYHLRKNLVDSSEKADLRLIYLAIAHIVKYRGHFLIEGKLNTQNSSIDETFKHFLQAYNQAFTYQKDGSLINPVDETTRVEKEFTAKFSRSKKAENVLKLFSGEKTNGTFMLFLKLIAGNSAKFKRVFDLEEEYTIQFSKEDYEENLEALLAVAGDEYADVFIAAKNAYDAVELAGILTVNDQATRAKLSSSMIERYKDHQADLKKLKSFIKKYVPEKYKEVFDDPSKNGYAGYVATKNVRNKVATQEEFYKYLKGILGKLENADYFINKMEQENFLRKQRTFDNGVIPHQIHLDELKVIIHNQEKYYPFLSNYKDKIEKLVTFRIPYFVGPLSKENKKFAWLTRKSEEAIRPWNLTEVVDIDQSAMEFIERMTNFDSYLPTEKVLPKHSMLYEKYSVYNELTKIKYVNDQGIEVNFSSAEKVRIFNELFKKNRKVSKRDLEVFLRNEYNIETAEIIGVEKEFNAKFNTYHDFIKIGIDADFLDKQQNEDVLEDLVKILTVFEDRQMIHKQLIEYRGIFSDKVLKKLERRHYTGWGRLSKQLINGITDSQSGKTILDYLIDDDDSPKNRNRNFMQLINDDRLSFKEIIQKELEKEDNEDLVDIVQNIPGSPAIKKGILQSLQIVDELVEIMGYKPKNIVVEMARENQTTSTGRKNSSARLKRLEDAMKDFGSKILDQYPTNNLSLRNDRLYLYYLQNGKDIYTGEALDIENLSKYDIDHIIPRSFITDNSIDNRVLTSSEKNRGKKDDVPSEDVVRKMRTVWDSFLKSGLMTQRKYDNLTRGKLTDEDKAGFIHRQLVETRQITKHVARILNQRFNVDENDRVDIVTLKSALTSQFRKGIQFYKVREINDYHHAHDAYLNGVVAITLLKVYPKLKPEFVYGDYRKFNSFKENKATARKQMMTNLMKFFTSGETIVNQETGEILWSPNSIKVVKKVLSSRQMNFTKKLENRASNEDGKLLFKQSISGRGGNGKNCIKSKFKRSDGSFIPLEISKYGGFIEEKEAFIGIEKGKLKSIKRTEQIHYKGQLKILRNQVFLQPEGFYRYTSSLNESAKWNQLFLEPKLVKYIYFLKRFGDAAEENQNFILQNREYFTELKNIIFAFIEKNQLADIQKIKIPENRTLEQEFEVIVSLLNITSSGTTAVGTYTDENDKKMTVVGRTRYTSKKDKLTINESILIDYSITGLHETRRKLGD